MSTKNISIQELHEVQKLSFEQIAEQLCIESCTARYRYKEELKRSTNPKRWYHDLSTRARNALIDEFSYRDVGVTKDAVKECILAGDLRRIPNVGALVAKEICEYLQVYPPYPDTLAKKQAHDPHWIDELTKPTRDSLLHEFKGDREALTKDAVREMLMSGERIYNAGEKKRKELCIFLGVSPSSANSKEPIVTVYVLKKLWVDELENQLERAMGYEEVGFTTNKLKAESMVRKAGKRTGTGWPIVKNQEVPILKITILNAL